MPPSKTARVETARAALVRTELVRKSLHFLIALCPLLVFLADTFLFTNKTNGFDGTSLVIVLLITGILLYAVMETLRLKGVRVPLVSFLTEKAMRRRDTGFVKGPVTLGAGAALSLILFPLNAASVGIYALAFGDGLSSLVGRLAGRVRPAFLSGKSIEGSAACFFAVFLSAWLVSRSPRASLVTALAAAIVEALPLKDWDNIAIPLIAAAFFQIFQRMV
jgi:dolichol kinase